MATTKVTELFTVRYDENHWNGTSGTKTFDSKRKATAFANKMQTKWCDREATGKIEVTDSAGAVVADYSIS